MKLPRHLDITRALLILGFALVGAVPDARSQPAGKSVDVTARVEADDLVVTLRNLGRSDLQTDKSLLPWGLNDSMRLIAIEATEGPGRELNHQIHRDDPVPWAITIRLGETKTGRIDLKDRFPDIEKVLKSSDVVILWYYGFGPSIKGPAVSFSGSITIPKR